HQDRGHPARRGTAVQCQPLRPVVVAPHSQCRPSAPGGHVPGQNPHASLVTRNRPPLRRARSYDRVACRAQDRGSGCQGYRALRRGRILEAPVAKRVTRRFPSEGASLISDEERWPAAAFSLVSAAKTWGTPAASLALAAHPRHLVHPPKGLDRTGFDRAFGCGCCRAPSRAGLAFPSSDRARIRMKVTVERAQLLKSLGHVHRVVERRNTIPILGNV